MDTEELTIPHPGIEYREFVLYHYMKSLNTIIKYLNMEKFRN